MIHQERTGCILSIAIKITIGNPLTALTCTILFTKYFACIHSFNIDTTLWDKYYYPHFIIAGTETQTWWVSCPRPRRLRRLELVSRGWASHYYTTLPLIFWCVTCLREPRFYSDIDKRRQGKGVTGRRCGGFAVQFLIQRMGAEERRCALTFLHGFLMKGAECFSPPLLVTRQGKSVRQQCLGVDILSMGSFLCWLPGWLQAEQGIADNGVLGWGTRKEPRKHRSIFKRMCSSILILVDGENSIFVLSWHS